MLVFGLVNGIAVETDILARTYNKNSMQNEHDHISCIGCIFYQVALGKWIKLIMTSSQQYIFQKLLYICMYMPVKQS